MAKTRHEGRITINLTAKVHHAECADSVFRNSLIRAVNSLLLAINFAVMNRGFAQPATEGKRNCLDVIAA